MVFAYSAQLCKTYKGKSEPHPIAWFGFGFLTVMGFLIQWQKGAGAGSWVMGMSSVFCFFVGGMSCYKKEWKRNDFDGWDWSALTAGAGLLVLYLISRNLSSGPLVSVVLVTVANLVLYTPIFKRTWMLPGKESATAYGLNSLKFVPSLFAMDVHSIETCLYPTALAIINAIVVVHLIRRRNRTMTKTPMRELSLFQDQPK
jgi:hypothetical protein